MQERFARAQHWFYLGLAVMLLAAMLPAAWPAGGAGLVTALTAVGAMVAAAARLRLSRLQRTARQQNSDFHMWATR